MSDGTIKVKKDTLWKVGTFVFGALVVVLIAVMMSGDDSDMTQATTTQDPSTTTGQQLPAKVSASADDDPFKGDENAEVVMIEFSDYECPFCKRHADQTLPQLEQNYIDNGKVKYVFRDFTPTFSNPSYHPNAIDAAMAAECVRKQGGDEAYWDMHDAMFANQGQINSENLKSWASDLGYDIGDCLDSGEFESEVRNDFQQGQQYGVRGTPGFLIGSGGEYRVISGACPYSAFQQALDAELEGKEWYSPGNCQVVVR